MKEQEKRWAQTLEAVDSVKRGEVAPAEKVHVWLKSWGQHKERAMKCDGLRWPMREARDAAMRDEIAMCDGN